MSEVPCKFCGQPTRYLGTRQCNNCYEVASRIGSMTIEVIVKILSDRVDCQLLKEKLK